MFARTAWYLANAFTLFLIFAPFAIALNPDVELRRYAITTWRKQDGLPGSRIVDVLQTSDGYLWVGTTEGLARFDGWRFVNYRVHQLTRGASDQIRCLLQDRKGRLWIGTSNGLAVLQGKTFSSIERLAGIGINGLVEDRDGAIWVSSSAGLQRWREGVLRTFSLADGLPSRTVSSGALAGDGSLWFGTDRGAVRYRHGSFETYGVADGLADTVVTSVHADRRRNIWVGTTLGLSRWTGDSFFTYSAKEFPAAISVFGLLEDRDSNIWFGGTNSFGPVRMRSEHFVMFPVGTTASNLIVYSYFEDQEGSLWIATSDGLLQLRDQSFTTLTTADGLPTDNIRLVYPTTDGAIWIGANRSGLARIEGHRISNFDTKDGLSSRGISALLQRRSGAMIAATTYHGLNLFQQNRWIPFLRGVLPTDRITGLLEDAKSDLWIGTEDQGVFRIAGEHIESFSEKQGLGSNFISKLLAAPNGEVWIGTDRGLSIWNNGALRPLNSANEFGTANVTGLLAGQNGAIWIATSDGLALFFHGHTTHLGTQYGIPEGAVAQPVEDDERKLWFFSSSGLLRFTPPMSLTRTSAQASAQLFTSVDGLASDSHGGPPQHIAKSPDGKIWIATARGLSAVNPAQLKKNQLPPPVHIEELLADGRLLDSSRAIELAAETRRVEIRYTGLSLSIPERVRFKYRLIGFDDKWKDAGADRSATYTNLSPGTYRFHVIASNNDGVWNTTGSMLEFSRKPYVYQTVWFRVLAVLMAALAGWGLYQLRLRQVQREFALVLDERTRIARELHDTLLQGFTAVTLQVQVASDSVEMSPSLRKRLQTVLQQADGQLREARRAVWDLRPSTLESRDIAGALTKLVETCAGSEPVVQLVVEGAKVPLTARVESAILRVAEEALANARRHSEANAVCISLSFHRDGTLLTIRDNGKGMNCDIASVAAGHFGLRGMQERVKGAQGDFSLISKPGEGTEIRAHFPSRTTRI